MGMRDTLKKAVGTLAAGIRSATPSPLRSPHGRGAGHTYSADVSAALDPKPRLLLTHLRVASTLAVHSFALAPGAARAMDSEGGVAVQPRLVLPSQEAFIQRPELLMSEPEPLHIRIVQSPIFQGSVGIVAAGAAGSVVYKQIQKRQTESMRSMLSSNAGIDIDSSILDEVLLRP